MKKRVCQVCICRRCHWCDRSECGVCTDCTLVDEDVELVADFTCEDFFPRMSITGTTAAEKRALRVARFFVRFKPTLEQAAEYFGVSRMTISKDIRERLPRLCPEVVPAVNKIVERNRRRQEKGCLESLSAAWKRKNTRQERIFKEAEFLISKNATLRETASEFSLSKSTVYRDLRKELPEIAPDLADQVAAVLDTNRPYAQRSG